MEERRISERDLAALSQLLKLRGLRNSPINPEHVAAAEIVLSRAGRATPPGTYQQINGRWCLVGHEQTELLDELSEAAFYLLAELAPFCAHRDHDYRSQLGKCARRLEDALCRVPGYAGRELPGTEQPYPWREPTLESTLDAAGYPVKK